MSDQAAHQSAQCSTRPVTRWKSDTVTPLVVKRGPQCAIAEATRSSMRAAALSFHCKRLLCPLQRDVPESAVSSLDGEPGPRRWVPDA